MNVNEVVDLENTSLTIKKDGAKKLVKMLERRLQEELFLTELKETIKPYMKDNNISSIDGLKDLKVLYKKMSTTKRLDTKKLKEEHEDIYNQYLKEVAVSDSVSITLK